ncbi:MAG TPA: hypothetical protein VK277_04445 [Acidimicrobiales bacterium]|nr:hypothetical protein [Acidimicrobiales bacterium]
MVEAEEVRKRIDRLITKSQDEVLAASRRLSREITREASRIVPPLSADMTRLVDEIFDFTERVLDGQRKMVRDVLSTIDESGPGHRLRQRHATKAAKKATKKTAKRAPAKKATAKRTPAKRGAKGAPAKTTGTRQTAG